MKRRRILITFVILDIIGIAVLLFLFLQYRNAHKLYWNPAAWVEENTPLISHAAGGLYEKNENGQEELIRYTNSREALERSLANGYKLIEIDLEKTTDGDYACIHGWEDEEMDPMSSQEWKNYKVEGKYTSMVLKDVLEIVKEYPDIYLITDIKSEHTAEDTREEFSFLYESVMEIGGEKLLARVIPQIYTMEMYEGIKEIYQWPSIIYTLYEQDEVPDEEIFSFVEGKKDIPVVTIPKRRLSEEFLSRLHELGKYNFSHTFNEAEELVQYRKMGVDGFYTDAILPEQFETG